MPFPVVIIGCLEKGRGVISGMIAGGAAVTVVGHYATKKQFERMSAAQAQESQIDQAQAQAAHAQVTQTSTQG
ncbi:MAG: hypothetical protein JO297_17305 [Nitrososphaeraceae archaeon]|nr:hypothetical protein [Nitrososphaeraceae archaeon]